MEDRLAGAIFKRRRSRSLNRSYSDHKKKESDRNKLDSRRNGDLPRRARFLERWSESPGHLQRNSEQDGQPAESTKESLPYIYQQAEFIRICTDLIRKCKCMPELHVFLSTIDKGGHVDLNGYNDPQVRKKFRHLGKALYLNRNGSLLSKPNECNISLLEELDEKLAYITKKVEEQGPYVRPTKEPEKEGPEKEPSSEQGTRSLTAQEHAEMMSLREMHQQGFFVDYENIQKEFMEKHAMHDVWGKTPQQQLKMLRYMDYSDNKDKTEESEPWRVFDREKEIVAPAKIDKATYDKMLGSHKEFLESFTAGKKHSSFI